MRRLCRQNVEASLLDDAEVQPTFAFSVLQKYSIFPDRTKNPIERFYGAIDEIYTTAWVAFSESISLGTESFISLTSTSSSVWRIKFLLVSSTTWRVGQGMAKERTRLFLGIAQLQNGQFGDEGHAFAAFYHAHKGLHAAQSDRQKLARADFIWQARSWSRKQWPSSSSQSCSPFRSEVRIASLLKRASSRDT